MAYAAVVSLVQILKQFLHSDQFFPVHYPKPQIESLYGKICSLQSSLEKIFPVKKSIRSTVNDLEIKIRDEIYKAQDTIESFVSRQSLSSESEEIPGDPSSTSLFLQDLQEIIANIDPITETAQKIADSIKEDPQTGDLLSENALPSKSSTRSTKIVGQEEDLELLTGQLLKEISPLQVVPIIGMPGIGKTTLAKSIYDDPRIERCFSIRAWVTVSPEYHVGEIFLKLLGSMEIKGQKSDVSDAMKKLGDEVSQLSEVQLSIHLYQRLFNSRYLIVIDDIWDQIIWDKVRKSLPDNKNGSRIILTTRIAQFADYASSSANILQIRFLNDDESWNLLHKMVFTTEESCHPQLEKIGRKIANNCEGHPLAIIEVGKLLCKTQKTIENWNNVAQDENPLIIRTDEDTPISKTLSLSYNQLPLHLKACFLYMGVLPKNYEISPSKLINLWVSEGFFEPQRSKSLEEMAKECLDDLISRSLILVHEGSTRGRTKTCRMHFVFRILCVSEAQNEKFFHVIKKYANSFPEGTNSQRRLCIHSNIVLGIKQVQSSMESVSGARSLLCLGPQHQHPLRVYLRFRLLRVLDALTIRFCEFPHEVLDLVHLRYLAITYDGEIPASISRLWNLEVLIVHRHQNIKSSNSPVYLPREIWNLRRLRHLECTGADLPDTAAREICNECDDSLILEKLLTLSGVSPRSCTKGILAMMPNLMKLGIRIESTHDAVETFSFFGDFSYHLYRRIESFKCVVMNPALGSQVVSSIPAFSSSLRKITLSGCGFSWEYMRVIAALQNLEVLKLRCYAFQGPEWETYEGEFLRLEYLMLEDLDIEHWTTDCYHFPSLTRLIIRHCYKLGGIPRDLGNIPTLEMIEVDDCSPSAMTSARQIQEEQMVDWGNDYLQFRIHFSCDD